MKGDTARETGDIEKTTPVGRHTSHSWWRRVIKILLPVLILTAGIAGASYIRKTAPKPRRRPPVRVAPLVEIQTVHRSNERVVVRAMGTVIPAREIVLKSRVSGEIVATHPEFVEGGFFRKGAKVLQIDPEDYKLAVIQKQSQVADATYALKLEQGHQDVAKREWELLNGQKPAKESDVELALRKPHLEKAEADLEAAEAELKQARLDLARTTVRTPFNSIVRTKSVDLGSQVASQDQLAELVGTDEYWIQVSVSVDRLKWITIPRRNEKRGSRVRIIYGNESETPYVRSGKVVKLLGDLETEGRMARILVSVVDPMDLKTPGTKRPPLLIGEYIRVEIEGRELRDVVRVPRTGLRDNSRIWVAGDDGRLHIRNVDIAWRDPQTIFLRSGLREGERLIVSDLAAPVEGMVIRGI
jgi:RND family efflux transporter MFP subunit